MAVGVDYKNIFVDKKTKLTSGADLIRAELELLLNFRKYGLFFGNNMGLDCERYIGLKNKVATFNLIKSEIEELFSKYGRAFIKQIEMKFNEETNSIDIDIECGISGGQYQSVRIPISVAN